MADIYKNQEAPVSIGQMFLGFRKLAAGLVWIQVDEAFHKGEMQRMVPLMRTTVLLDPNFVDAYLIGAWHLAYNLTAQMSDTPGYLKEYVPELGAWVGNKERAYYAAANFLKDGIRNNPRDYRLYFDLGYAVYAEKLNDHMNAVTYLTEATKQRHESWVRRMLYHSLQATGQFEEARAGWEDYLRANPGHAVAQRMIPTNTALTKQRDAEALGAQARRLLTQVYQARADGQEAQAGRVGTPGPGTHEAADAPSGGSPRHLHRPQCQHRRGDECTRPACGGCRRSNCTNRAAPRSPRPAAAGAHGSRALLPGSLRPHHPDVHRGRLAPQPFRSGNAFEISA